MPKPKTPAIDASRLNQIDAAHQSGRKSVIDTSSMRQIDAFTHGEHDRANIPPVGMAQYDTEASPEKKYEYDPHIDPSLQWAGKKEGTSFTVPTSSIHIHESIKPHKIIRSVQSMGDDYQDEQGWLFESDAERAKRRNDAIEFYRHKDKWTNRLIAGDSLVIMNSLLEKEGMAGQVQMVYIDPPYGIKYGSNFQPFVNKRDVKDKKDEDLTSEPEMIKAFRDTWELGVHSYLTYLRDRLLLARELLHESGSVFVQIGDENIHHIKELLDEIFGKENSTGIIVTQKTSSSATDRLDFVCDYIVWYAKSKEHQKYHQLFTQKGIDSYIPSAYNRIELSDGVRRSATREEKEGKIPLNSKLYTLDNLVSSRPVGAGDVNRYEFNGKTYKPGNGTFKSNLNGLNNLKEANRLESTENRLGYVRYLDDFPAIPLNNVWNDVVSSFMSDKIYLYKPM
jgi:adenine-specific DNA-methyltransferase